MASTAITYSANKCVPVYDKSKKLISVYYGHTMTYDGSENAGYFPNTTAGVYELLDVLGGHVFKIAALIVNPTTWSQNTESYFTLYQKGETTSSGPSEPLQQTDFTAFDMPDMPLQCSPMSPYFMALTHSSTPAASDALKVHLWIEVID